MMLDDHDRHILALPRYRLVAALGRLALAAVVGLITGTVAVVLEPALGPVGAWVVAGICFVAGLREVMDEEGGA